MAGSFPLWSLYPYSRITQPPPTPPPPPPKKKKKKQNKNNVLMIKAPILWSVRKKSSPKWQSRSWWVRFIGFRVLGFAPKYANGTFSGFGQLFTYLAGPGRLLGLRAGFRERLGVRVEGRVLGLRV